MKLRHIGMALLAVVAPTILFAQEATAAPAPAPAPYIDFGNTAWMIVATALVMLMTIPGLALFYGGLVRQKKRFKHPDAVFYFNCCNNARMGILRIQPVI